MPTTATAETLPSPAEHLQIVVTMLVVAGITAAVVLIATGDNDGDAEASRPAPKLRLVH